MFPRPVLSCEYSRTFGASNELAEATSDLTSEAGTTSATSGPRSIESKRRFMLLTALSSSIVRTEVPKRGAKNLGQHACAGPHPMTRTRIRSLMEQELENEDFCRGRKTFVCLAVDF